MCSCHIDLTKPKSGAPHIIAGTYSFFLKQLPKKKERIKWKKQENLLPLGVNSQRRRTAGMKRERATSAMS